MMTRPFMLWGRSALRSCVGKASGPRATPAKTTQGSSTALPRLLRGSLLAIAWLLHGSCTALVRLSYGSTAPQTSVFSLCIAAAERRESPPPPPSRLVATTGWCLTRRPFGGPVPPPSAMPPVNAPNSHGSILPVSKVGDQTKGKGHHPAEQDFFDGVIEFCHNLGLTHL